MGMTLATEANIPDILCIPMIRRKCLFYIHIDPFINFLETYLKALFKSGELPNAGRDIFKNEDMHTPYNDKAMFMRDYGKYFVIDEETSLGNLTLLNDGQSLLNIDFMTLDLVYQNCDSVRVYAPYQAVQNLVPCPRTPFQAQIKAALLASWYGFSIHTDGVANLHVGDCAKYYPKKNFTVLSYMCAGETT